MTTTASRISGSFLQRVQLLGHDPEIIEREGYHTTRLNVGSIQDLRKFVGPSSDATRRINQAAYDKALDGKHVCLGDAVQSYLYGTGKLTPEHLAELAPSFPTVVTMTSAINHTLPPGETLYGPNHPPVVLNYDTLTIPYGSWMTTQTTNLSLNANNLIVSSPTNSQVGVPSYQIGIMGAPLSSANSGSPGKTNTDPGQNGGSGNCIWGGGGCKNNAKSGFPGNPGGNGGPGDNGQTGLSALAANITIGTLTGGLNVASQGGEGQAGGQGGEGGQGSQGGNGGYGTGCGADSCNGGNGGTGGQGGNGGSGGNGGNGGGAQTVIVTLQALAEGSQVFTNPTAAPPGAAGSGGAAGAGGPGGKGGGSGTGGHNGHHGPQGPSGAAGVVGTAGTSSGPVGQIVVNPPR